MSTIDFTLMFPGEDSPEFKKAKQELPYSILLAYANAFNNRYKDKIVARITESSHITNVSNAMDDIRENLVLALSFEAAIGSGYLYRLLEIEQLKATSFPVQIKVFRDRTVVLGTYSDFNSFSAAIVNFLDSRLVKAIILNLLAQVDLYRESRSETEQ